MALSRPGTFGGDILQLPNRRVTIGFFPRRRVDRESSIGRCVALVEDDECSDLMHAKASLPKTRLGEGHREAHIRELDWLSPANNGLRRARRHLARPHAE